jgi:CRISPR-associated protein Cmr2
MPTLLILNLGPVQDFIAAARRCRDLWFGSWLLSELSKAGAAAIAQHCGLGALIFPAPRDIHDLDPGSDMSVANKLVALLPDGESPQDSALRAQEAIRRRLHELRDEALADKAHFDRALTHQQLDDLLDIQWVSAPVDSEYLYGAARERAEALLAAAKNTRLWRQPSWPTGNTPKSSIDGLREAVTARTRRHDRGALGLGDREHLCGVGLLKRTGKRISGQPTAHDDRFFSTPHLAALPLLERFEKLPPAKQDEAKMHWQTYLTCLGDHGAATEESVHPKWHSALLGGHDGQLLFASRIAERFDHLDLSDSERVEKKKSALQKALPHLSHLLGSLGGGEPLPYIAILIADGDRMGDAINALKDPESHRALSQRLDDFARGARKIVEDHRGQLIYAGGDDVLAFVPLHRVLTCARALADDFAKNLAGYGRDGASPTLSVGISITHFMDPMNHALATARRAEKVAKRERNSLAIILDKRSGPPVEVSGSWTPQKLKAEAEAEGEREKKTLDHHLTNLIDLHRRDAIPDKFIQDLLDLAALRAPADAKHSAALNTIAGLEFDRILDRKRAACGTAPITDADRAHLPAGDPTLPQRLLIAKILADATDRATPSEPRP